jgi:hypothetical protein
MRPGKETELEEDKGIEVQKHRKEKTVGSVNMSYFLCVKTVIYYL